jgi:hypothetical protein
VEIEDEDGDGLDGVAGSFEDLQAESREVEGIAVFHGDESVFGLGARTEMDDGAAAIAQFQMAGDEIGVEMSEKDVANVEAEFFGVGQVLLNVALRVDHDAGGAGFVSEQIRGMGEAAQVVLFQNHRDLLSLQPACPGIFSLGGNMSRLVGFHGFRWVVAAAAAWVWLGSIQAADVDPKVAAITPADRIKWEKTSGIDTAILAGDPSKDGLYVILVKWHPHNMSRPHFHPNDRYVTVVSGTWWVGTGAKYDPEHTVPVHAGSYVRHFAKQIHYDGAKDEEVVLEIVGMGPETMIAAEKK